jgi:hypothetical protein
MTTPLEDLARRVESDPFFLANPLHGFQASESLSDDAMAEFVGCTRETLMKVRLCGSPDAEPRKFAADLTRIAETFGLDKKALTKAVRRGRVLVQMQEVPPTLLAARDRKPEEPA